MLMAVPREQVEVCLRLLTEATLRPVAVEMAPMAAGKVFALSGRPLPPSWLLLHLEDGAFELTHIQGARMRAFAQGRNLRGQDLSRASWPRSKRWRPSPRTPGAGHLWPWRDRFQVGALKQHELEVIYPSHLAIPGLQPDMNLSEVLPAVGAGLCLPGTGAPGGQSPAPGGTGGRPHGPGFFHHHAASGLSGTLLSLGDQRLYPHPRRALPGQPADSRR